MNYPKLVRNAKTPVHVVIEAEEPNEYNERVVLLEKDFSCNYQDNAKVKYSGNKQDTSILGVILIDGDICPESQVIASGYVLIFGKKRLIDRGTKARNLDGTVNYTRLDVI